MRILMLHNRYQQAGGEDASTDAEVALLRQAGHEVDLLEIHNDRIKTLSTWEMVRLLQQTVWNEIRFDIETIAGNARLD